MTTVRAAIIAGGLATRMGALDQPKATLPIGGVPLIAHQVDALIAAGCDDITICAGHLAGALEDAAAHRSDVRVRMHVEDRPLGSGGCIAKAFPSSDVDLVVLFGDVMMNLDVRSLIEFHQSRPADATLVVHPNDHPHDSDLVEIDSDGWITALHRKPHPAGRDLPNQVTAGVFVLSPDFVSKMGGTGARDLVHDILFPAFARGTRLAAYVTDEYLKDIGTPERYEEVCADWASGAILTRSQS